MKLGSLLVIARVLWGWNNHMDVSMILIFIMVSKMIELSSRLKNIIFWTLTVSISLIVFGVFVIDIFVTDAHGKDKLSIIFSYLSTIFAFLSALALFATIAVYFWQKNDEKNKQFILDKKIYLSIGKKIKLLIYLIESINSTLKKSKEYKSIYLNDNYFIAEHMMDSITFKHNDFAENPTLKSLLKTRNHNINLRCDEFNYEIELYKPLISYDLFLLTLEIDNEINSASYFIEHNEYMIYKSGVKSLNIHRTMEDLENEKLNLINELETIKSNISSKLEHINNKYSK
ncbi:TPA: hypothetical protein SMQ30_000736 [Proteus mirabilis]|nr:hypothetical protein [Proteus mirabilis]